MFYVVLFFFFIDIFFCLFYYKFFSRWMFGCVSISSLISASCIACLFCVVFCLGLFALSLVAEKEVGNEGDMQI